MGSDLDYYLGCCRTVAKRLSWTRVGVAAEGLHGVFDVINRYLYVVMVKDVVNLLSVLLSGREV